MPFNSSPNVWFSGLTVDSSGVTFPYSSMDNLTQADSDPTTGDMREIVFGFCEALADNMALTATADRPSQLSVTRTATVSTVSGQDILTKTYTIRVNLDIDDVSVVSE